MSGLFYCKFNYHNRLSIFNVRLKMTKKKVDILTLDGEIKRLSNLAQFRGKDKSVIEKVAQKNLWIKQISIENRFEAKHDKQLANKLFEAYLENYEFQTFSDVCNVADLVFDEVMRQRLQENIGKIIGDETNKMVPAKDIEALHNIEDRILMLKEKTGISVAKEQDALNALEELKKKFAVYIPFNRNEFTLAIPSVCKKCGTEDVQFYLLRRRVKDFDVLKHPYFVGRYLFNVEIQNDYRDGKITAEQAARYCHTSPQMIQWNEENRYKILEIDEVSQEEITDFIQKNPFLPSDYGEKNKK